MRSLILAAAALLAGCSAPPPAPDVPKGPGGCSCESKICICPHCKGGTGNCPCKAVERPK